MTMGAVESRAPIVVKDGEKPLTAIARHYLETSNCPRFMPQDIMRERKQRLADLAKEYKADGIIVASNKFCEYWSYERTIDTIVMPRDFGYPVCSIEKDTSTAPPASCVPASRPSSRASKSRRFRRANNEIRYESTCP